MADLLLPAWLDSRAVDDAAMGRAYEVLGPQGRAVLKKCIARLHVVWGERASAVEHTRSFRQGFCAREKEEPAPFALVVCPAHYPHPAPFLAALLPALLAGVEAVLPVFTPSLSTSSQVSATASSTAPGTPGVLPEPSVVSPALLAALELAGVERAFVLHEEETLALAEELGRVPGGKAVVLGLPSCRNALALRALELGMACVFPPHPPVYFNEALGRVVENSFFSEAPPGGEHTPPAQERGMAEQADFRAALCLDGAHEDVWVWPDVGPAFFRTRRMHIAAAFTAGQRTS